MPEKKTLRAWRKERDLTQMELAVRAHVGLSTVADCETGRKSPRLDNARKLADALEIGLDDIEWDVTGDKSD